MARNTVILYLRMFEKICKTALVNCINKIVTPNINELVRRATWLSNDKTHYIRKREDRDIHDLKNLSTSPVKTSRWSPSRRRILKRCQRRFK